MRPTYCCFRADCEDTNCAGREIARLHECEGGETVNAGLSYVFPTIDPTEQMPARFRLPPKQRIAWKYAPFLVVALIGVGAYAVTVLQNA